MRLLTTLTGDESPPQHWDSRTPLPPYAILSHCWREGKEVTFDQLSSGNFARNGYGWRKVSEARRLAREASYSWIWIDTCCINKASSSEDAEAINSMFRWYKAAAVCYVFLDDELDTNEQGREGTSNGHCMSRASSVLPKSLGKYRWFSRGWTLQELLAPDNVLFYHWGDPVTLKIVATKRDNSLEISEASHIEPEYLLGERSIWSASVAKRMTWAVGRDTKRPEDRAYCLLGIFDVNMDLRYGEGDRSFTRLQLEIIAQSDDDSIFAWSIDYDTDYAGMLALSPDDFTGSHNVEAEHHQGLPAARATMSSVFHTSWASASTAMLKGILGDLPSSPRQVIRLKCLERPNNRRTNSLWLTVSRAADGRLYRARLTKCDTGGVRWPAHAVQNLLQLEKQLSISSRSYEDVKKLGGVLDASATWRVAAGSRWWGALLRLIFVGFVFIGVIFLRGGCSTGENFCAAVMTITVFVFAMRDIVLNKLQFWALILLLYAVTSLWPGPGSDKL